MNLNKNKSHSASPHSASHSDQPLGLWRVKKFFQEKILPQEITSTGEKRVEIFY